jgi:hypothetical protein
MDRKETIAFLRREQEISDMKAVMATVEGRRFIWRQLKAAGIYDTSFVGGAPDITAFKEGARNLGLMLLGEIMTEATGSFLTMQKEATDYEAQQRAYADEDRKEARRVAGDGDLDDGGR